MTEKIPISLSNENLGTIERLEKLLGMVGWYGSTPKVIKFSINFTLSALQNPNKVYADLNQDDLKLFFETMARYEIEQRLLKKSQEMQEMARKV